MPPGSMIAKKPVKRVFTGCLTCRRRKKKCDERHPQCVACARNHLPCEWPGLKPEANTSTRRTVLQIPRSPGLLTDMRNSPEEETIDSPGESGGNVSYQSSPYGHDNHGHAPDDCYGSRSSPQTAAQEIGSSEMPQHEPLQSYSEPISPRSQMQKAERISSPAILPTLRLLQTDPKVPVYALLDRYINVTAPRLVVYQCNNSQNPFIELLIPVAFQYQIVLDSILAFTAAHSPIFDSRALYGSVVSRLRHSLSVGRSSTDVVVATMMLCFFETAEGENKDVAMTHLKGLVRLLDDRHKANAQTVHDNLVMECLFYHSITTDVFSGSAVDIVAPLLPSSSPSIFNGWDALTHFEPTTNALCGLSWDILKLILRVSHLYKKSANNEGLSTSDMLEGLQIANLISTWKPTPCEDLTSAAMAEPQNYQAMVMSAELWKIGAFMSLLMVLNKSSLSPLDSRVVDAVEEFTNILVTLPGHCAVETCLNWPLVIVGSYAVHTRHRNIIQERLFAMGWLEFRNIALASRIIQISWQMYDETGAVQVEKVMQDQGCDVILS